MQSVNSLKLPSLLTSLTLRSQLPCCAQFDFVRWRKPRWIPQAQSKKFRLSNRIRPPPNIMVERRYLLNSYFLQIKSLCMRQKDIHYGALEAQLSAAQHQRDEEELDKIIAENERVNNEIQARREQRRKEEWQLLERQILEKKLEFETEEERILAETEKDIERMAERAKTAISESDLDEFIEKALAVEIDYNFSIDKDGNKFPGRFNNKKKVPLILEDTPEARLQNHEPVRGSLQS